MLGTLINAATVLTGGTIGLLIHNHLPRKLINVVFQGIGLVTLGIGISMSLESKDLILIVVSVVLGALIGEWIDIDKYLRRFSDKIQARAKFTKSPPTESDDSTPAPTTPGGSRFTEAFITASMLYCVGSMAILGPIEDGMGLDPKILITKSIMDGIAAIALASSLGAGVLFSIFPVLIYQGTITLLASSFAQLMTPSMIANMTGVGGILLLGLALNILNIKEINVTNMLPSLVVILALSYFF